MICSQCGKDVLEKACGPTHAVLTAQYKRAKELVERWMWKKKASKRYEKLKQENRFRVKVELWTEDDDIQIIR